MSTRWIAVALAAASFSAGACGGCHGVFIRPRFDVESRAETRAYAIRTDLSGPARLVLAAAADGMREELEAIDALRLSPGPGGAARDEPLRELLVFKATLDFHRFLRAHLFTKEQAIGFYCDLGGECALVWREPPGLEDIRVLRHELVHQHLGARLLGRLPAWLEEGLAERLALGPEAGPARRDPAWRLYRKRRNAADAAFGALEVHSEARSWPDQDGASPGAVPPPTWAAGDRGYVLHLLFVRFLESIGEGFDGAIGAAIARARSERGEAPLDLSPRFATLGEVDGAFRAFVLRESVTALGLPEEKDGAEPPPGPAAGGGD